jgi:hypothetical protein
MNSSDLDRNIRPRRPFAVVTFEKEAAMVVETANGDDRIRRLHNLANTVRTAAEGMRDHNYRRTMCVIAECYERMARQLKNVQQWSLPEKPSPRLSPET